MHYFQEEAGACTIDAAYLLHGKKFIGSLEVDKRADLIVPSLNPFDLVLDEIAENKVLDTMMNDKGVHEEAVDWNPPKSFFECDICNNHSKTYRFLIGFRPVIR